jgi:hypothetical protein
MRQPKYAQTPADDSQNTGHTHEPHGRNSLTGVASCPASWQCVEGCASATRLVGGGFEGRMGLEVVPATAVQRGHIVEAPGLIFGGKVLHSMK